MARLGITSASRWPGRGSPPPPSPARPPAPPRAFPPPPLATLGQALHGWTADSIYLSPAPLYHAAPLGWSMAMQSLGGTVIMMERFDAEDALRFIEQYRVTT